jgi:hypothetical protein
MRSSVTFFGGPVTPPPPAPRPALEADGICSGGSAILYGSAPPTARQIWIEVTGAAPVAGPAFDAGAHFGRAYWAATIRAGGL